MNRKMSEAGTDASNVAIENPQLDIIHNLAGFEAPQIEIEGLEVATRPDWVSGDEVNIDTGNLVPAKGRLVRVIVLAAVVYIHVEEEIVPVHQLELLNVGGSTEVLMDYFDGRPPIRFIGSDTGWRGLQRRVNAVLEVGVRFSAARPMNLETADHIGESVQVPVED